MEFVEANADQLRVLGNLVLAMLLGGLVGWERETADKPAGLRTHMLISGASALFVSLGTAVVAQFSGELGNGVIEATPLRIIEAVVAGVSFLGAGTIIRGEQGRVAGLTTAASVLFTAALGVSVAIGQYLVAAGATFLLLVTLRLLVQVENRIMVAAVPFDWQVHDTYFVVAHFHYVLIGGVTFPVFAAVYYWFPKIMGRIMNEGLGKLHFWLMFIGFNVAFFPMHISGFMGMPRRVYTYSEDLGIEGLNLISTIGAFTIALSVVVFLVNIFVSARAPRPARRRQSVECRLARMVHRIAGFTAGLRRAAHRPQPAPPVGRRHQQDGR